MVNQNSQVELIYPTVDLFLYDLKSGLGQDEEKVTANRREFWQKIYGTILDVQLEKLKKSEKDDADFVELFRDYQQRSIEPLQYPFDGYYYPVQLGDTYGLQVNCTANYIQDYQSLPQSINCLHKTQEGIISNIHQQTAKLGQTWFVWGQLADANQDFDATAAKCFEQLDLPAKQSWSQEKKGKFLGGNIYELWQQSSKSGDISDGYHVLICLFPHHLKTEVIRQNIVKLYPQLMRLFRFRHKILWAYSQSQDIKTNFKNSAALVQNTIADLNQPINNSKLNINFLQKTLSHTPEILLKYTNILTYLDDQRRTIKVNIANYNKRCQKLKDLDAGSQWDFLQEFSDFAQEKFLEQIESDQANIASRLTLMENTIKTVQGIIDIERTKNERTLNSTIAIAGVGLATSQLASAVILAEIPDKYKDNALVYQTSVFWYSLIFGLLGAFVTFIFIRVVRFMQK